MSLVAQDGPQLALAPHGVVQAQGCELLDQSLAPARLTQLVRPTGAVFGALLPAVQGRAQHTDRLGGPQPASHGLAPAATRALLIT